MPFAKGVVPQFWGLTKHGLIKHYNWHDAPFKGWEEVDTLYQNHHKAPKLVDPGGGWVWTKRFSFGKFVIQTIFCGENDLQKLTCTSESVSIGRPRNCHWNHHFGEKNVFVGHFVFQTCHPTLAQFLQRTPRQHPGPPFFFAGKFGPPKNMLNAGFSRWWFHIFLIFTPNPWGRWTHFDFCIFFRWVGLVQPPSSFGWLGCHQPQIETHGPNAETQVNPMARMAEGGTETQQCSAWVAQREWMEDGLQDDLVQYLPRKTTRNMEPKNGGLEYVFPFQTCDFQLPR